LQRRAAGGVELRERKIAAERVGIGDDVGVIVGVDDCNRSPLPVPSVPLK